MTRERGVAFAGAGFISVMHALALRACGGPRVVAVASQSLGGAQHRAHLLGADAYRFADVAQMTARPDVEVVFVLSPNALHAEHALAAIEAGKHVVIEKPLAVTCAEAARIVAAAERRGVGTGYAENQVFAPVTMRARELVAEGAIGRVQRVVGFCGHAGPPRGSWFWDPRWAGGGAQLDMGSHTVETALYLAGQPAVEAVLRASIEAHPSGVDGRSEATLLAEGGVEIEVTSSFVESQESMHYEVHGDAGTLLVVFAPAPFAQRIALQRPGRDAVDVEVPHHADMLRIDRYVGSMGYVDQLAHFLACFEAHEPPRETAVDGARVLAILNAIYLAAGSGRRVRIADVPADLPPLALWKGAAA